MNNLGELTNREYLSGGTEIPGRGGGDHVENEASRIRAAVKCAAGYTYCLCGQLRESRANTGLAVSRE